MSLARLACPSRACPRIAAMIVAGIVAIIAAALLGACSAVSRPKSTPERILADAGALRATDRAVRDSLVARLVRRAERRADRTLDLLMLSGGGQNGAFGVGFLRGWASRPTSPMPRFDLVTGISTGALQAPYALLGTAAALDTISAIYARAATTIAPTVDWWFWLRRTGGVVNTARYDRALEQSINGEFRGQLRRALGEDRQIVVATTDFDLGIGRLWSLGDVLGDAPDSSEAALARTRSLLKAATAIPGIFPPVMLDGHLHADGGVVENVTPVLTFADYERLGAALAARGLRDVTVRVWVVMNMWTHAEPRVIAPANRKQIASRSTALLFYLHQPATLAALADLATAVSERVPGVRIQVSVAMIPDELSMAPGAMKLFDRAFMARLHSVGFAKARSASPWDAIPSAFARPSR